MLTVVLFSRVKQRISLASKKLEKFLMKKMKAGTRIFVVYSFHSSAGEARRKNIPTSRTQDTAFPIGLLC